MEWKEQNAPSPGRPWKAVTTSNDSILLRLSCSLLTSIARGDFDPSGPSFERTSNRSRRRAEEEAADTQKKKKGVSIRERTQNKARGYEERKKGDATNPFHS